MKLDWETIYDALLESAETRDWVEIGDEFSVRMWPWERGQLHIYEHSKTFTSHYVMCCDDAEEFTGETASYLLAAYERFLSRLPKPVQCVEKASCWEQVKPFYDAVMGSSQLIRNVYHNCYAGNYYGDYSFEQLMENDWNYGLPRELALELWRISWWYLAEGYEFEEAA